MLQSPYRRGAEDGLIFGLYLTVLFYCMMFSQRIPLLSLPALALMAGVPVVIFIMQRRYSKTLGIYTTFSMLWMQGLVIFACGCAIGGVALLIYLRWINPDAILDQLKIVAELKIPPEQEELLGPTKELATQMIEAGAIPRAIDMVIQLILTGIVTGSILSLITGVIISATRKTIR